MAFANNISYNRFIIFLEEKLKKLIFLKRNNIIIMVITLMCPFEFENNILASYISNWFVPGGWSVKIYTQNNFFNFTNLENCSVTNKKTL